MAEVGQSILHERINRHRALHGSKGVTRRSGAASLARHLHAINPRIPLWWGSPGLLAHVYLANAYLQSKGTSQNYGEAMHWYRNAADQGSAVAEWMIGGLYFHGWGVIRDFTEAATWYRRAAEAGVPVAQWDLGMMYYQGYGVSKDLATARAWLQKAADRGYAPAKDMLAKT